MDTVRESPHLARFVSSVLASLGVPGMPSEPVLPEVSRACVLLVDGLGWDLLHEYGAEAPTLCALAREPLDAGYPSTTAAGLAAIGTGVPSGEHGMVGYSFAVPGGGAADPGDGARESEILNVLRWCAHPDGRDLGDELRPEAVQPLPTTFARAGAHGVTASVVSDARFARSPLTRAVLRDADYVGVRALGDLTARALRALRAERAFCYAYHSDLDMLGHVHGPGSPEWRMQLRCVDHLVATLAAGLPADSLLAVVADHGMVAVDDTVLDVDACPELRAGVRAIGGEVRARHVYTEDGACHDVLGRWRETLGERAWVVTREEAIEQGWFGTTVSDRVRARIGDVVAAARGCSGMLRTTAEPHESALLGQHGSHTRAERLVPLLLARP